MKKILLTCLLLIAMVVSLAACGGKNNPPSNEGNNNETPHTHSFDEWEVTAKPTCTKDGTKVRYCSCGEKQSEIAPMLDHTPAKATIENKIEATCNTDGSYDEVVYCSVEACKEELSRESKSVSALGHDFKITENVEATCLEDGHIYFECQRKNCSETKKQTLLSSGHYFGEDKVCDNCGYTEADNHIHSYTATIVAPTCTSLGYTLYECTCGDKYRTDYIEQKGHRWNDGAVEIAKTCTKNGVMLSTCLDCTATHREAIAASHEWSETITEAPTCVANGSAQKVCSGCGVEEGVVLPAAHTWGTETVIKQNTCTEKGLASHTCTVCGVSEEFELELLGHTYKNGTCTKCGKSFTEGVTPYPEHPEYGMYFEIDDIISKYGPDYINEYGVLLDYNEGAKIEKVAVFLTQDGTMWRRCIACVGSGIEYATYVPYLSYENDIKYTGLNSQWINIFPLKENSDGIWCYSNYTTIGVNLEDQYGNLLLSLYDIGQAGTKTRVFDDLNEMIAWLSSNCDEHIESDWIVDSFASCTSIGSRHTECINCGAIITTEISPATGHSYVNGICTSCGAPDPDYVPEAPNYSVGLEYTSNGDGTCYVSGIGSCTDAEIVIPETSPEGWRVVAIGSEAFKDYTSITSIYIPYTVTKIGIRAFNNCTNLSKLKGCKGVLELGFGRDLMERTNLKATNYNDCWYIEVDDNPYYFLIGFSINYTPDSVVLHEDTKVVGTDALVKVEYKAVYIPEGLYAIGFDGFYSNSIFDLSLPDSLIHIGDSAFYCSYELTNVVISNNVKYIGVRAFGVCDKLSNVYYKGTVDEWNRIDIKDQNEQLLNATRYYYSEYQPTEEGNFWHYVDGVPTIWLEYIHTHSYSTQTISPNCTDQGYTKYTCNCGDSYIANYVQALGHNFIDGLCTVCTQPDPDAPVISKLAPGLYDANDTLLVSWENLVSIYGLDLETDYLMGDTSQQIGNIKYILKKHPEFQTATKFVVGGEITRLGNWAFFSCNWMVSLILPDELLAIGEYSISYNDNLTHVSIPDSVTTIEPFAFTYCTNLTNVVIPDNVTSIGDSAFNLCKNLMNVTIGKSVTSIGSMAFYSLNSLTSITVDENNTEYQSIDGNLYTKDGKILVQYAIGKTDTNFVIPDSVTVIGAFAFEGCGSLTSVKIPNSVASICDYAFSNCHNLKSITIPDGVTNIGFQAFFRCSSLTEIVIPDSVISIGNSAYAHCDSLTIYCKIASQPTGWSYYWNYSNCPVVWGYAEK